VSTVDPIKVYFNISEREYLKFASAAIASGKKPERVPLDLILVDGSFYPHPGKFAVLNRQVDPTTGTFKAAASFPTPTICFAPASTARSGDDVGQRARCSCRSARSPKCRANTWWPSSVPTTRPISAR
jgi:hypothetical protein